MKPDVAVAIPVRNGDDMSPVLRSLGQQQGVNLTLSFCFDTQGRGANWARNRAVAALPYCRYLLLSDCDIWWERGAVRHLVETLQREPKASWAFGSYEMGGTLFCQGEYHIDRLRRRNIASTMSLIRRETFPGFDETIGRLQDWDLWLTMAAAGHMGVQCGRLIFRTAVRDGITQNGPVPWQTAVERVRQKHNLVGWK